MAYYTREDFNVVIETKWNKYSKEYLHTVKLYRKLEDNKFQNIDMYSNTKTTADLVVAKQYLEEFEKNFIVSGSIEIDLNYTNTGINYDTVWIVDFEKNVVKCLNGVTGAEAYHIDTILKHTGDILVPCSGTAGRWNRLEVNYQEFREQLEVILKENNYYDR